MTILRWGRQPEQYSYSIMPCAFQSACKSACFSSTWANKLALEGNTTIGGWGPLVQHARHLHSTDFERVRRRWPSEPDESEEPARASGILNVWDEVDTDDMFTMYSYECTNERWRNLVMDENEKLINFNKLRNEQVILIPKTNWRWNEKRFGEIENCESFLFIGHIFLHDKWKPKEAKVVWNTWMWWKKLINENIIERG